MSPSPAWRWTPGGGKLYFGTLEGSSSPYTATLRRANLDGSDLETVYTATGHRFWSLSLDLDINHPPTTTAQVVQVAHNMPVTFPLDARDPNANSLRFTLLTAPENGVLAGLPVTPTWSSAVTATYVVTYTPATGFVGQDRFTYRVEDSRGAGALGEVNLNVWPVNPVYAAINAPADNAVLAPGAVPITVSGYALYNLQALTLTVDGAPVQTWTYGPGLTEATGTYSWAPTAGRYTLAAQARDQNGNLGESVPTRVIVDAAPPTVTLNTLIYTSTHAARPERLRPERQRRRRQRQRPRDRRGDPRGRRVGRESLPGLWLAGRDDRAGRRGAVYSPCAP